MSMLDEEQEIRVWQLIDTDRDKRLNQQTISVILDCLESINARLLEIEQQLKGRK